MIAWFCFLVAGLLLAIPLAVKGFNWMVWRLGLEDDSWPLGPR